MNIFAIADLHLSFSTPNKSMEIFGPIWKDYEKKIEENWKKNISTDDLVLIAGDISWAMKLKDALIDLEWLHNLPGKKIIIKGNHDYWWPTFSKLQKALPPSIDFIQNNAITIGDISIAGARLWDSQEFSFNDYINFIYNPKERKSLEEKTQLELNQKIYLREVERLKLSLNQMDKKAKTKIVMTHYPPISADLIDSQVSKLFDENHIDISVFGHLHNVKEDIKKPFGKKNNTNYLLTSSDYLRFNPLKIL